MKISCMKASELASKGLDEKLSFGETLRMYFHHALCLMCSQFCRQIAYISRLFKSQELLENAGPGLKPEARDRLKRTIKERCSTGVTGPVE